jgi:predicted RNase H-related nuclease YkuK (DUF458 family)
MWLDPNGNQRDLDDIIAQIDDECEVFVGSDSQLDSGSWVFASVICLYWPGHGGRYFYKRDRRVKSTYACLEDRLLSEVYSSVIIADQIRQTKPSLQINVHADIASNVKHRSNKVAKIAQSYISGMGFLPTIKPDSWAAGTIADKLTR